MALKLYNHLGKKEAVFAPLNGRHVGLYTCGPTVYDFVHLGNWRTFIVEDILKRTLTYLGYEVDHVMNITDVDDKIIKRAALEEVNLKHLTGRYTELFLADTKKLNISAARAYPKATEHVPEMIALIERLLERGLAYEDSGAVYFAVKKFDAYGKLSGLKLDDLLPGARVDQDEYKKDAPADFVLWKKAKTGEPSWDSPWGPGRPGWHLECSAMSMKYLGETFDIHMGGVDLLFPHHENEIAQSEGATGKPLAKWWLEAEHLMIDGEKMSKSLGNIYTLKTLAEKDVKPPALRYLFLTAHYRKVLNFTWESLAAAATALTKLENFTRDIAETGEILTEYKNKFTAALEDDLNTPQAVAIMWELINNPALFPADQKATILDFDHVLGLGLTNLTPVEIPPHILDLAQQRETARQAKNFAAADLLRQEVFEQGYLIDDTPMGPKIHLK